VSTKFDTKDTDNHQATTQRFTAESNSFKKTGQCNVQQVTESHIVKNFQFLDNCRTGDNRIARTAIRTLHWKQVFKKSRVLTLFVMNGSKIFKNKYTNPWKNVRMYKRDV